MTETYYINITPNKITIRNLETGEEIKSKLSLQFGNKRVLIAGEEEIDLMIKHAIKQLSNSFIRLKLRVIIHPFHPEIKTFTKLENNEFIRLGERIGASEVFMMRNSRNSYSDSELIKYLKQS